MDVFFWSMGVVIPIVFLLLSYLAGFKHKVYYDKHKYSIVNVDGFCLHNAILYFIGALACGFYSFMYFIHYDLFIRNYMIIMILSIVISNLYSHYIFKKFASKQKKYS